jgi:hypothetical protein
MTSPELAVTPRARPRRLAQFSSSSPTASRLELAERRRLKSATPSAPGKNLRNLPGCSCFGYSDPLRCGYDEPQR